MILCRHAAIFISIHDTITTFESPPLRVNQFVQQHKFRPFFNRASLNIAAPKPLRSELLGTDKME